jgi:cellulose biosynthesis protein BcsQ
VLKTTIREDVAVKRAAKHGCSVADLDPRARATADYQNATKEILDRLRLKGYVV